jgi:hypothetical protein
MKKSLKRISNNPFSKLKQASFVVKLKPLTPKQKRLELKQEKEDIKAVQNYLGKLEWLKKHEFPKIHMEFATAA